MAVIFCSLRVSSLIVEILVFRFWNFRFGTFMVSERRLLSTSKVVMSCLTLPRLGSKFNAK